MELSVIIPVYNSKESLDLLLAELHNWLDDIAFEIILVNDGSKAETEKHCKELQHEYYKTVSLINLRRNYGEHNALLCGLNHCKGNYAVTMDDDLQNPASEVLILFRQIQHGFDVVYSKYKEKKHHPFRNLGSWFTNKMATAIMEKPANLYLSSFKILSRPIIDEVIKYQGPFPYLDGLIIRCTDNIGIVETIHAERQSGKSGYTIKKLLTLYLNMFVNFSIIPLRMFTFSGILIFIAGIVLTGLFIYQKFDHQEPAGWTSTAIFILLTSGFQIIFLGLISEYIGKLYLDQNKTPQWVIKDWIGHELNTNADGGH